MRREQWKSHRVTALIVRSVLIVIVAGTLNHQQPISLGTILTIRLMAQHSQKHTGRKLLHDVTLIVRPSRDIIRKGIEQYTDHPAALWAYLHDSGMVLKVEGELPDNHIDYLTGDRTNCYLEGRDSVIKAGYTKYIQLLEKTPSG